MLTIMSWMPEQGLQARPVLEMLLRQDFFFNLLSQRCL